MDKRIEVFGAKVSLIMLLDGLTNEMHNCGKALLQSELSALSPELQFDWGDYYPVERDGEVETTEVYPFFFGIDPCINPGRSGFELYLDGDLPCEATVFVTIRADDTNTVIGSANELGIYSRVSRFSDDKKTVLLASSNDKIMRQLLVKKSDLWRVSHYYSTDSFIRNTMILESPFALIGWCHGALSAALSLTGMEMLCNIREQIIINTSQYNSSSISDEAMISGLIACRDIGKIPVVYLKHFAYDARHGYLKNHAAKNISKIILCAINTLKDLESKQASASEINILVISDHNSEIGVDRTIAGKTVYGMISNDENSIKVFRNNRPQHVINQHQLVGLMNLHSFTFPGGKRNEHYTNRWFRFYRQ